MQKRGPLPAGGATLDEQLCVGGGLPSPALLVGGLLGEVLVWRLLWAGGEAARVLIAVAVMAVAVMAVA